jgi:hypothetical protein
VMIYVRRGFVASRRVIVSSTVGSHWAAVVTEWVTTVAGMVKSTPCIGGSNGMALCSVEHGRGGRSGTTVVWCMERHKAVEAVLRWQRLVQNCVTLAMKTVVAGAGSKRVANEKASAEGTITSGVMHMRGFWVGNKRAMDGIPGSIKSQLV